MTQALQEQPPPHPGRRAGSTRLVPETTSCFHPSWLRGQAGLHKGQSSGSAADQKGDRGPIRSRHGGFLREGAPRLQHPMGLCPLLDPVPGRALPSGTLKTFLSLCVQLLTLKTQPLLPLPSLAPCSARRAGRVPRETLHQLKPGICSSFCKSGLQARRG